MDIKALFTDDDAVSPVIGVILMVAITVILAAVIASFVLGLGNNATDQSPTASFSFDYEETGSNNGIVTVSHDGGDTIKASELYLRGSGFVSPGGTPSSSYDTTSAGSWADITDGTGPSPDYGTSSEITSGQRVVAGVSSSYEIDVVWQSQEKDTSSTLSSDEGPDA